MGKGRVNMRDGKAIAAKLGGKRFKTSWKFRCPCHKDNKPSAVIRDDGLITCFAGCSRQAVAAALDKLGFVDDGKTRRLTDKEVAAIRSESIKDALQLWQDCEPNSEHDIKVVAGYLKSRGITVPVPQVMRRYKVNGWIASIQDIKDNIVGVQWRIPGQTPLSLGTITGNAIHLSKAEGTELGLAEGLETALSCIQLFEIPCWCACGAKNMPTIIIPSNIQRVHIFAENDDTGREFTKKAADVFLDEGLNVKIWWPLPQHKDYNDYLKEQARCQQ